MRNAVQAGAPLVVRADDAPRRGFGVCRFQHEVAGSRIIIPASIGLEIHRAQLPLTDRIIDPGVKALLLLFLPDLKPNLDQSDPAIDDEFLDLRGQFEEALVFFLVAEAHDVLDPCPVVPAAVKDHDLSRSGKELDIALHEQLRLLTVRGGGQRDHADYARADTFGQSLDGPSLSGGITSLEDDDDARPCALDPRLKIAEIDLKLAQFPVVELALHTPVPASALRCHLSHDLTFPTARIGGRWGADLIQVYREN